MAWIFIWNSRHMTLKENFFYQFLQLEAAKLLRFTHLSEYIIWYFTVYTAIKTVQERFSFSRIVEKVISFETLFLQLSLNVARRVTKFCKKISQKIRYQDCMEFFYKFESLDKKSLVLFKGFIW